MLIELFFKNMMRIKHRDAITPMFKYALMLINYTRSREALPPRFI